MCIISTVTGYRECLLLSFPQHNRIAVIRQLVYNMNTNQSKPASSQRTYAQTTIFPSRNQAIIIHAVENFKLQDYVYNVGLHIGPANILFSSRISNNRICIYLKSSKLADQFSTSHPSINIGNINLKVRKLLNPSKKLILSNVSPHIPHSAIEKALTENRMKLSSPISFMRAGLSDDQYKHVLSFRRQLYFLPDVQQSETDEFKLPESLLINYEDEQYRIYLSSDEDHPHSPHTSESILTLDNNTNPNGVPTDYPSTNVDEPSEIITPTASSTNVNQNLSSESPMDTIGDKERVREKDGNVSEDFSVEIDDQLIHPRPSSPKGNKRALSQHPSPAYDPATAIQPESQSQSSPKIPANKKNKMEEETPDIVQKTLVPLKETIQQQNKTLKNSLDMKQLTQLIEASKQYQTAKEALLTLQVKQLNIQAVIAQLQTIHGKITDRSTKIRITKLIDKIQKEYPNDGVSNTSVESKRPI